jgi:GNAT superfamily N-acetyltransferase
MLEQWYRQIRLRIPFEEWQQLPPLADYKNEYYEGTAVWSPRPKWQNAVLDLASPLVVESEAAFATDGFKKSIRIRSIVDADWEKLPSVMAAAFHRIPPFRALNDRDQLQATHDCIFHTRDGGDGELLADACLVAVDDDGHIDGAILVTRWTSDGVHDGEMMRALPTDAHITWVFVALLDAGHGIGTAMLVEAVAGLRRHGFRRLFTTFTSGNESSMRWHWRNGFKLLPNPLSPREIRKIIGRSSSRSLPNS